MNLGRCPDKIALVLILLSLPSCKSRQPDPPAIERLEQLLSVSFPQGSRVIGGIESPNAPSLWLIASPKPLPLPSEGEPNSPVRAVPGNRPQGTYFPVSALSNLMAASGVTSEDLPTLVGERGITRTGQVENWQFSYRAARTEQGWLTAVEIQLSDGTDTVD